MEELCTVETEVLNNSRDNQATWDNLYVFVLVKFNHILMG